ncbi:MAG: nucleoside 2-deoxyribosyltransferase [Microthrixaceae bacterium]|nr:nucleoside 2-deoxyribosyltransferase [Microthrixaceae bacterium]
MVPRAYLAGPEVFLPDAAERGAAKKAVCREVGLEGVYPLDPLDGRVPEVDGLALFEHCLALLDRCDLVIANLTPFRGPSMDVGTAVEMGYALGSGRPVYGYTNVATDYRERVTTEPGWLVEDFGLVDNLMCEGTVRRAGGPVVRVAVAADDPAERLADLTGFREVARRAARDAAGRTPG